MKKLRQKLLIGIITLCLVVTIIIVLNDFSTLAALILNCEIRYLLMAFCCIVTTYSLRFLKWHLLLKFIRTKISLHDQIVYYLASLAFGLTPGKLGETIKAYFLRKDYRVHYSASIYVILAERLCGLLGSLLLLLSVLLLRGKYSEGYIYYLIIMVLIISLFLMLFKSGRVLKLFLRIIACLPFLKTKKIFFKHLFKHISILSAEPLFYAGILLSWLYWTFEGLTFWNILRSINYNLPITSAFTIFALSSIIGGLSMMPGSLGVLETGMIGFLVNAGVPFAMASVVTLLHRFFALLLPILFGSCVVLLNYNKLFNLSEFADSNN